MTAKTVRTDKVLQIYIQNPGPALPAITPAIGTHDRQDCKDGFYNYILISRSGVASTWDMTAKTVDTVLQFIHTYVYI